MADLGAKAIVVRPVMLRIRSAHPSMLRDAYPLLCNVPTNGFITGIVRIAGVPTVGVLLRLYSRESGVLLDQIKSAAGGVYRFVGMDPTYTGGYQIMALDPSSAAPHWYTLVHDHRVAVAE